MPATRRTFLNYLGAATIAGFDYARAAAGNSPDQAFGFTEVRRGVDPNHHLPEGYRTDILIRWGDPLAEGLEPWRPGQPDPRTDPLRFGFNNDFLAYFPLPYGSANPGHGLLCVNHEYVSPYMMWPAPPPGSQRDRVDAELSALGHTVLEVIRDGDHWRYGLGEPSRRTTMHTPVVISGPAAGHHRMRNQFHPDGRATLGVLGACGGGKTPWGTVLVAEENFNFYFTGQTDDPVEQASQQRYGVGGRANYAHWTEHYPRYRSDLHPRVANGYGWVVEIDPYTPQWQPRKRTALGRCKHESANCVVAPDGRVVVYSGDDGAFEYIYRFVSRDRVDMTHRENNLSLLDHGTLSVARFTADGTLEWVDLVAGHGPLKPENGFNDQSDVLIDTRRAADLAGATRMDRPEEIETNPLTGEVFVILTNNARRTPGETDSVNPRAHNLFGHILRLSPPGTDAGSRDHAARRFAWDVALLAGNPRDARHRAHYPVPVSEHGWFAAPDNCAFDPSGQLWIATDQGRAWGLTGSADGVFACRLDGAHGEIRRFFRAPIGAEVCGPEFTPDGETLFLAIQHPGVDGVAGASYSQPGTRWPDFDEDVPARSSVVAITREGGGKIGA